MCVCVLCPTLEKRRKKQKGKEKGRWSGGWGAGGREGGGGGGGTKKGGVKKKRKKKILTDVIETPFCPKKIKIKNRKKCLSGLFFMQG